MVDEVKNNVFTVHADFLEKKVKASFSGDTIAEKGSKVKKPFKHDDSQWICAAYDGDDCGCYRLVPKAEYTGPTRTYDVPEGREYKEYYEELEKDPNGSYHGMLVKWGKMDCVLVGPVVRFRAEKPKKTEEVKTEPTPPVAVPKKILPKVVHQQENLKCVLTQEDLVKLGQTQATALQEQSKNDDDFRTMQTAYKNKQAVLTATIKDVSERIRNGYEFRYAAVTITTDYENDLVSFIRDDTGELYSQRSLNTAERQFKLDLQADKKIQLDFINEAPLADIFPREGGKENDD